MKKLILAAMIAASATPAFAVSDENCKLMSELARVIMMKRQERVALSAMLDAMANVKTGNKEAIALIRPIIILAYKTPAYETAENQQEAIADFVNQAEVTCYGSP